MIQAHFENIKEVIKGELSNARQSIKIAVAWFTDSELFEILILKAKENLLIELLLLDDEINNNCRIKHSDLNEMGGCRVYKFNVSKNGILMHNKFCIVDSNTVITGSYNWSYKARVNHENITIATGMSSLVLQFEQEFNRLINNYFKPSIIDVIIDKGNVANELLNIPEIYSRHLTIEMEILRIEICGIENEIITINKNLSDFKIQYDLRLGPLILQLFELQKLLASVEDKHDIESEIDNLKKVYNRAKKTDWKELNDCQAIELKNLFRKAIKLCHPDLVPSNSKEHAEDIFKKIKIYYDQNDIENLQKILSHLEKGVFPEQSSNESNQTQSRLETVINNLSLKKELLIQELSCLKSSSSYKTLVKIDNYNEYFVSLENKFRYDIISLKNKVDAGLANKGA